MLFALTEICRIWGKVDFLNTIDVFKDIFRGLLLMGIHQIILRNNRLVFDLVCLERCCAFGGIVCFQGSEDCKCVLHCLPPEKSLSV